MHAPKILIVVSIVAVLAAAPGVRAEDTTPAAAPAAVTYSSVPPASDCPADLMAALLQEMSKLEPQPAAKTAPAAKAAPKTKAAPAPKAAKAAKHTHKKAPAAEPSQPAPATATAYATPPPPGPQTKEQRLAELLKLYKADSITPEQYHMQRVAILAEP